MSTKLRKQLLLVIILFLLSCSFNLGNLGLRASAATTWNTPNTGFEYPSDNRVGYGNGQWLLFSYAGEFGKSSNGVNWGVSSFDFSCTVNDAFYWKESPGNTKWITACEQGQIYTLHGGDDPIANPSKWVSRASNVTSGLYSIAASDNKAVIVGENGTIFASKDANNWTDYSPGNVAFFHGVTYGEGKFIAVGEDYSLSPVIYTSVDGEQWEKVDSATPMQFLIGVTYGAGKFVAVGSAGYIYVSEDGVNWEEKFPLSASAGNDYYAITYSSGKFYAAGLNETIISSLDGINWVAEYKGNTGRVFYSIKASENGVIAAGDGGLIKTYIKSTNNKLSSLTINPVNLPFSPDQENYSTTVENTVAKLTVTATVQDPTATVSINGTVGNSVNVPLNLGPNTINVV